MWFWVPAISQNTIALPEIVNYSKQVYKAGTQNWDICQDNNGLLYFANNEGLLSFDGTYWRLYPLPNKTIVRSVALGNDHKIYVGAQDEIGYFSPDNTGQLTYHSLINLIPQTHRSFSDVWDICCINKQVFFRSNQKIFLYSDDKIIVYPTGEWLFMGKSHNGIIAQDSDDNLLVFKNGVWSTILKNNGLPAGSIITSSIEMGRDATIITTLKNGIYVLGGSNCTRMTSPDLDKIVTQTIYTARRIDEDRIALGTNMMGCYIIDNKGTLVQHFSRFEGLQNNNALCVFADRNKNVWLGLDNGIDFVAYNSSIKSIFPDNQNEGSGYSCIIHNNILYIATTSGLYDAPLYETNDLSFVKSTFTPVQNARGQVWNISVVNDQLLIGHHEGAYLVENNRAIPIDRSTGFWTFLPLSTIHPSPGMIAGTYKGIRFFKYQDGNFIHHDFDALFESARFITVDDDVIWVSHPYKGVFKVSPSNNSKPSVTLYNEKYGLSTHESYIFKIKSRVVAATEKGIYEYDRSADRFEPSGFFKNIFGNKVIRYLKEDSSGNVWFVFDKSLGVVDFSAGIPKVIYIKELNNKLVSGFEQVYPLNDNNIFVGAEKGYFHINYAKYKAHKPALTIQLRQVRSIGKIDSLLFQGYFSDVDDPQVQHTTPSVSYQSNSFHFEFSCPLYEQQSNIQYSYFLKGYDNHWSEWTNKTEKEYTYLPSGTYEFLIKASNNLGVESAVSSYTFIILPPWYQTWWANSIYACLLVLAIYLLYRWQKRKFVIQQERYEEKQKRLRDVHQLELEKSEKEIVKLRNEKLEAEIHHKNKEMASATMHLVKKGELITKVKDELQRLNKVVEEDKSFDAIKKMIKALDEDDKMDEDWEHFTIHFDKVHNDFFIALKKQHANLTPSELKLCAYLRMNLSTKEMAQLMNISVRGVEISRYRLRKKLQIPTETNLFNYLLDFHTNGKASG
jgi:ligand-binding sensor domain-containing protein/DNA-binding CsgD family transcriptional regulator